jgi:hypothetical protein
MNGEVLASIMITALEILLLLLISGSMSFIWLVLSVPFSFLRLPRK